jgi:hypothetical protein
MEEKKEKDSIRKWPWLATAACLSLESTVPSYSQRKGSLAQLHVSRVEFFFLTKPDPMNRTLIEELLRQGLI